MQTSYKKHQICVSTNLCINLRDRERTPIEELFTPVEFEIHIERTILEAWDHFYEHHYKDPALVKSNLFVDFAVAKRENT